MPLAIQLPDASGTLLRFALRGEPVGPRPRSAATISSHSATATPVAFNRIAYSAAHVVADPRAAIDPWLQCAVDWDATIAFRRHLWSLGLGVWELNYKRHRSSFGRMKVVRRGAML